MSCNDDIVVKFSQYTPKVSGVYFIVFLIPFISFVFENVCAVNVRFIDALQNNSYPSSCWRTLQSFLALT